MKHILFVGAPFGRFFRYVSAALAERGVTVWRTVCDGGDYIETPAQNRIIFRGSTNEWPSFIEQTMRAKRISAVITFNDSCPRSRGALAAAASLHIPHYVLENGYLRPWWITFDRDGVNGNSILPRDASFYLQQATPAQPHVTFKSSFRHLVRDTIVHYAAAIALAKILPYDSNYYGDSVLSQATGYVREYAWRKLHSEHSILATLQRMRRIEGRKIFVALMQKPGDAQLKIHSEFRANNPYVRQVIESFANHADPRAVLVLKQHPLDYGVEKTPQLFNELVRKYGLEGRAFYIRKLTIESVLDVTAGLITVNSTGGLASIRALQPTISLGNAIYDMDGLTYQDGIDLFWTKAQPPDAAIVDAYFNYLTAKTQVNGGFHTAKSLKLLSANLADVLTNGAWAPHHELRRPKRVPAFGALGGVAIPVPVTAKVGQA